MFKPVPTILSGLIILVYSQQSTEYEIGNGVDIFVYQRQRPNQNSNYQHIQKPGYGQYEYTMPGPGFFPHNPFMNFQQESTYQQPLQYHQPYEHRPTSANPTYFYYGPQAKYEHPHNYYHHHHHRPPPPHFNVPPHNYFGSGPNNAFGRNYFQSMAEVPNNANNIHRGCNGILTNQQIPVQPVMNFVSHAKSPTIIPTFPNQPSAAVFPNIAEQSSNDKLPETSPAVNSSPIPIESSSSGFNDLVSAVFPGFALQGQKANQHQISPPPVPFESVTSPIPVFQPNIPIDPKSPTQQKTASTIPVFQLVPITLTSPEQQQTTSTTAIKTTNGLPTPVADDKDKDEGNFNIDVRLGFADR